MTAVFLSDVHLSNPDGVKTKLVLRFLQEIASRYERIYILGDFFDVWPGTRTYFIEYFQPVLQVLKRLVAGGHEVHYLEGNHDFRLGDYFPNELGVKVYTDKIEETWDGKKIYMEHGDLGNPKEIGYRALRHILRNDLFHAGLNMVPDRVFYKLGQRSSQFSRKYLGNTSERDAEIRGIYRKTAEKIFSRGYDVVIMGHTHLPDDYTVTLADRTCRYLNTGDWVSNFTFLEFDGHQFYTRTHPVRSL